MGGLGKPREGGDGVNWGGDMEDASLPHTRRQVRWEWTEFKKKEKISRIE